MSDGGTVLVVDDHVEIRAALCDLLEEEGFVARGVANGSEALEYLRQEETPRLILLDLMMPEMDGWQFRAAQRADPAMANIPVVVLSAIAADPHVRAELAADDFILKPATVTRVLDAVSRAQRGRPAPQGPGTGSPAMP